MTIEKQTKGNKCIRLFYTASLYLKKASLASRNIVHKFKTFLRCIGFYIFIVSIFQRKKNKKREVNSAKHEQEGRGGIRSTLTVFEHCRRCPKISDALCDSNIN